jgi:hypothetical protein
LLSEAIYATLSGTKVNYEELNNVGRPKSVTASNNKSQFRSKEAKYTYGTTDPEHLIKKHREERREFFTSGLVKTNFGLNNKETDIIKKYKMTNIKPSNK